MAPMTPNHAPRLEQDAHDPGLIRLSGHWTLKTALDAAEVLRGIPDTVTGIDATRLVPVAAAGALLALPLAHPPYSGHHAHPFRPAPPTLADRHAALAV
mgnify:CR=1 FL=1